MLLDISAILLTLLAPFLARDIKNSSTHAYDCSKIEIEIHIEIDVDIIGAAFCVCHCKCCHDLAFD